MKAASLKAGVYRNERGEVRVLYGHIKGKSIQSHGNFSQTSSLSVMSGSTRRFREVMGDSPIHAFSPDEIAATVSRISAYRPKRLCNQFDRWLFYTSEGKTQLVAMTRTVTMESVPMPQMFSAKVTASSSETNPVSIPFTARIRNACQRIFARILGVVATCARHIGLKHPIDICPKSTCAQTIHCGKEG